MFERPPEVGPLGPESREGIHLTVIVGAGDGGEVRDPCQVATPKKHLGIADEPLPAELAQDLEHAEPLAPGSLHALDERLLDEGADDVRDRSGRQVRVGAHLLRGVDLETAREDG